LHIAFYGSVRQIGTSANMSAVAAGITQYLQLPVSYENMKTDARLKETMRFTDCSRSVCAEQVMKSCDLLVINLSYSFQELAHVYLRHSLVRKNVVFLIGKYIPNNSNQLKQLAKQYRISENRICMIPYNPRFSKAYENHRVFDYLNCSSIGAASYEDFDFCINLNHVINTMITYVNRKGDNYHG